MAYDVSDLTNGNPWHEGIELETLPVYRNHAYSENHENINWEDMRKLLLETADDLGLDLNTLNITDNAPDEERKQRIIEKFQSVGEKIPDGYFDPTALIAETEELRIIVWSNMTVEVFFEPPISLPSAYNFSDYCSYEDMLSASQYLQDTYAALLNMSVVKTNIHGGDYDIYKRQMFQLHFFEGEGDIETQMVNYAFRGGAFYSNEDGQLWLVRVWNPDLSDKVGDYPIISVEDAKNLLSDGRYITTVPYELPGMEYVAKVELMYRNGARDEYHIPYYRFLVELPEEERDGGMKTYGAYYVPAVHEAYISNMPIWDGSFS